MTLAEIEKDFGFPLPNSYKELVSKIDDFAYVEFNEFPNEFPEDDGSSWFFWSENRLAAPIEIEGAKTRPAWQQLASFAEVDKLIRMRSAIPSNIGPLPYTHLENSFCIAEDNGDLLYISHERNNSVWIYMHSSGEVKNIAPSFDYWLSRAKVEI
jgi:hypothetical protein